MSRSEFVTMPGGLTVPIEPVRLAWDLEARGCHFEVEGDTLFVGPRDRLTDDDRVLIRRWKLHLIAIVTRAIDGREERPQ